MRWVTIKPVAAQRTSKTANKTVFDIPQKPAAAIRAARMLADAPPELRLPRAVLRFVGNRPQFPLR